MKKLLVLLALSFPVNCEELTHTVQFKDWAGGQTIVLDHFSYKVCFGYGGDENKEETLKFYEGLINCLIEHGLTEESTDWMLKDVKSFQIIHSDEEDKPEEEELASLEPVYGDYGNDYKAWYDKHSSKANAACEIAIERRVKYDYKWTNSFLTSKFTKIIPATTVEPNNLNDIVIGGDAIKLQNGFGAWQNQIYLCYVDTLTGAVRKVLFNEGRF